MASKRSDPDPNETIFPPARSPEDQEQQMISLAMDLAEKQLRDGTASSQTINHFLKLATEREKVELALLEAKVDAVTSHQRIEELYSEAIQAIKLYQGVPSEEGEDDADLY